MMRASLFRLSPLLLLGAALVATAALFSGGAPAEAQNPATVTRAHSTPDGDLHIQVRAGNYYKVLGIDDETLRASGVSRAYEGDVSEVVVAVGSLVGVPDFSCFTRPGTATESKAAGASQSGESDYVNSGQNGFPIVTSQWAGGPGVITLPIITKAEDVDPNASPPKENTLEPIEYFEVECLPQGTGSNLWRADGSARARIEIIDQARDARLNRLTVKSSTDGTTFPTTLTLSPGFNKRYTEYSVLVGSTFTHVNVRPEGFYEGTTATVDGVAVARGSTSDAIALEDGAHGLLGYTFIEVQVTAVDGETTRDHTVIIEKMPAAHLSDLEVLDEYGSLVTRPPFQALWPEQAQVVLVAPGIRRIKVKPHWLAGSTMSVAVSTTDMTDNSTLSTATVTTSGTESGYLTLSSLGFGSTKLNISVTEGSTTTEYPKKYVTRELNAANADNYLNSMGVSPNPNARVSFSGWGNPGYYNVHHREPGPAGGLIRNVSYQSAGPLTSWWLPASGYPRVLPSDPYTPVAGLPQQNSEGVTLTPAFDPYVQEYTATVPNEVSSIFVNPALSHPKATATVNGNSPSTPVSLQVGENVVTVVVTAESGVQRTYTLTITRKPSNRPPAVASAIADATIINESGTRQFALTGVFSDADGDALTITANTSDDNLATVSVSADHSTLTVTAKGQGTVIIGVNANDGRGGEVWDLFTVTVKAAPTVASAIADISGLEAEDSRTISMSGVFSDADGDAVTVTEASSSDTSIAAVSVAIDGSTTAITAITVTANSEGTATITVTARDADGNTAHDAFDVTVNAPAAQQQQKAVELPGPVVGLELTATHDSVSVNWSAPESGDAPVGYIVNIKRQGGGDGETRRPGAGKTSLTFRDLNGGSTYQVWVRAQNEAGKGERTHASVTLPSVLPGPVTGLEVAATEEGVTVSWSAPETGGAPDGYIVHVRPEGGAEGSGRTKTPRAKKTQVSFENLEAGRTYKVWVRAQNEAGKGERVHASITLPEAESAQQDQGETGEQGDGEQQDGQSGQ